MDFRAARCVNGPMPRVGDLVTPSIRLVRELGSGGMGSVWVADHATLQTQVVVKFMHAQLAADRDSLLRFSREAAAGASVKSPHVVQVLDHGIDPGGAPFIVMELLEGCDLATYCETNGPMPLHEVAHVISQTCKALSRAHERGIIHRDIKPQNIFLTNAGGGEVFVKVLDFGIAKASESRNGLDSATKTGTMMGTPFYMSPEQMVGAKGIDHRTDLWGVGVVAFECLTGQKPFNADTIGGLAVAVCNGPMPVPSQFNTDLSADLDRWFAQACSRDVAQRFQFAKEMAEALQRLEASRRSGLRFASDPGGAFPSSPLASTEPGTPVPPIRSAPSNDLLGATEPAPALGISTRAPVSAGTEQRAKRPGRWSVLAIAGSVLLVAVATIAIKGGANTHTVPSAAGVQTADSPPPVVQPPPADPPKPVDTKPVEAKVAEAAVADSSVALAAATPPPVALPNAASAMKKKVPVSAPAPSSPCKVVKTLDRNGEPHFSCPCSTCQ
jgi:eukaryotic-like serine/threonine-protein kinase